MLKLSKTLNNSVLNEKHKCSLSFICSCSAKGSFTHKDFPFINLELLILSRFITLRIVHTFPFISTIFPSLSSLQVIIICFALFVIDNRNRISICVACSRCFCTFLVCLVSCRHLFLSVQGLGHRAG